MVQVEVRDDNGVYVVGGWSLGDDVRKVGKPPLVVEAHVHAAVQHDVLPAHGHQDAASADVLAGSQRSHLYVRHLWTALESLGAEIKTVFYTWWAAFFNQKLPSPSSGET